MIRAPSESDGPELRVQALGETETFYNRERPHQALENKIIQPQFDYSID